MYSGHIVFTGEVVCIGQSLRGVDNRPHATSFNTALTDFLLEQQVKSFCGPASMTRYRKRSFAASAKRGQVT